MNTEHPQPTDPKPYNVQAMGIPGFFLVEYERDTREEAQEAIDDAIAKGAGEIHVMHKGICVSTWRRPGAFPTYPELKEKMPDMVWPLSGAGA